MMKTFVLLSALVLSTAAFAGDGKAGFRVLGGTHVSFDYEADMAAGKITGTMMRQGFQRLELTNSRAGGWTGNVGGATIEVAPIQGQEEGVRKLTVRTFEGIFNYSLVKNRKGDLEIRAVGPKTGSLLIHEIT